MWTKEKIEALIGTTEGLHMEFTSTLLLQSKEEAAKKLSKETSALANAEGGTIVIGLEETKTKGQKVATALSAGVSPKEVSATWVIQIIQDNISPPLGGLRVESVPVGDTQMALDSPDQRLAFVIEVPRHTRAVQAKDNVFYQRQGDRSMPMRAYQIDDVNNRSEGPDIELSLRIRPGDPTHLIPESENRSRQLVLEIIAKNKSDNVVDLGLLHLVVPQALDPQKPGQWTKTDLSPNMVLTLNGQQKREAYGAVFELYLPGVNLPLFKLMSGRLVGTFGVSLRAAYEKTPHLEPIVLIAEAPRMHPRGIEQMLTVRGFDQIAVEGAPEGSITLDGVTPLAYFAGQ